MTYSSSPSAEPEYFYIKNRFTGLVLTPKDALTDPGVAVRLFPVEPDLAGETQLWSLTGSGLIVNKASGLVLDVFGGRVDPGAPGTIIQWRAKDSSQDRTNQQWRVTADGQLQTALDDRYVLGALNSASGALATLEPKDASPAQRWEFVKSVLNEPTKFLIEHVRTGALLTPRNGVLKEKTTLALEPGTVSYPQAQLWTWSGDGPLGNSASGMVADVKDAQPIPGEVILWPVKSADAGAENQLWTYGRDGRIHSGLDDQWVLGPREGGTDVRLVRSTGSADEQWRVRRAVFPEPVSLARAVRLNGADQALSLVAPGPVLRDFTAEAWVRTGTGGPVITSRGTTSETTGLALGIGADGALVFQVAGAQGKDGRPLVASVTTGPTAATDGEWHHLAATRAGNALTVYLDGVAVQPVEDLIPVGPLGDAPEQRLQFGTIRGGSGVTSRDWLDGDLAEVRLWNRARTAVEIPATVHHRVDDADPDLLGRWAFVADSGRDSSLAGRDATLIGKPSFLDSAVELVPRGDFYLVTQARLIQDWVHDPEGTGTPTEVEGYRVTLNIRDGDDLPAVGFITVALNNPTVTPEATLHFPDGTATTLTAARPRATLTTDAQGVVSFTMPAAGQLTAPMLRAQADFMTDGGWLVIAPDRQAHAALSSITGNALRGRDENGTPIPGKTAPLPDPDTPTTADSTAAAIRQMMSTAVQHNVQADRAQMHLFSDLENRPASPYVPRGQRPGLAIGHDPETDAIGTHYVDHDDPVARLLIPENAEHAHWAFDFTTFTAHTPAQAAQEIANLSVLRPKGDVARELLPKFGPDHITGGATVHVSASKYHDVVENDLLDTTGGLSWLKDHVANAVRVVVNTVETTIVDEVTNIERKVKTLVVTAVDALEEATYAVIQAVEHAVDVVAGFLEKLGSDIKALVSFLKALFRWQDVVNTQRIIHTYLRNLETFVGDVLVSATEQAGDALARFRESIDDQIEQWRQHLRHAGAQSQVNAAAASPPADLQTSYVNTMTSANIRKADIPGLIAGAADGTPAELAEELGKGWTMAIGEAWADIPAVFRNSPVGQVSDIKTLFFGGIELILDSLQALVDATLKSAGQLVEILRKRITDLLHALFSLLRTEIHIPVVTPFFEKIVMHDAKKEEDRQLTLFALASLVGAMGVTFTYKLATGSTSGPFTEEEANEFCDLRPEDYTWLVNPFAPRPDTAHQVAPPMQGARYNLAITGVATAADFVTGITTMVSDMMSHDKYKPSGKIDWQKVVDSVGLLGQATGLVAQALAVADLYEKDPDAVYFDKWIPLIGTTFSGLSLASAFVATYWSEVWEVNDYAITVLLGAGSLVVAEKFWEWTEQRGKSDTVEARAEFANGLIGGTTSVLQGVLSLIRRMDMEPSSRAAFGFALIGVDAASMVGLGATDAALLAVFSQQAKKERQAIA